ncbi:MAG: transcription termination/antitermination protein NusG [Succinivibrionaceae bacterium]
MANEENNMKWFVVQTSSGYELRVQKTLLEQIKRSPCAERFGEVIVPTEEVVEVKNGVRRKSERKFFPGYVLIHMVMDDETWHLVKDTNHVQGFLGCTKDKPVPLRDDEAAKLLAAINPDENAPKPKTSYEVGEQIRVCSGPFKEYNGTIEKVDYDKNLVTVAVSIFGRPTPVELEFSQVEKL